jgi:hypothetical protein
MNHETGWPDDIVVDVGLFHWNERGIVHEVLKYWNRVPVAGMTIFDNHSDDDSLDIIEQFCAGHDIPLKIIEFGSENREDGTYGLDDIEHATMRCDFVLVPPARDGRRHLKFIGDFDEVLFCHDEISLSRMIQLASLFPVLQTPYIRTFSNTLSTDILKSEEHSEILYHANSKFGVTGLVNPAERIRFASTEKPVLFNSALITYASFQAGGHEVIIDTPAHGMVPPCWPISPSCGLCTLHLKPELSPYEFERSMILRNRLSKNNRTSHYGDQYDAIISGPFTSEIFEKNAWKFEKFPGIFRHNDFGIVKAKIKR